MEQRCSLAKNSRDRVQVAQGSDVDEPPGTYRTIVSPPEILSRPTLAIIRWILEGHRTRLAMRPRCHGQAMPAVASPRNWACFPMDSLSGWCVCVRQSEVS